MDKNQEIKCGISLFVALVLPGKTVITTSNDSIFSESARIGANSEYRINNTVPCITYECNYKCNHKLENTDIFVINRNLEEKFIDLGGVEYSQKALKRSGLLLFNPFDADYINNISGIFKKAIIYAVGDHNPFHMHDSIDITRYASKKAIGVHKNKSNKYYGDLGVRPDPLPDDRPKTIACDGCNRPLPKCICHLRRNPESYR